MTERISVPRYIRMRYIAERTNMTWTGEDDSLYIRNGVFDNRCEHPNDLTGFKNPMQFCSRLPSAGKALIRKHETARTLVPFSLLKLGEVFRFIFSRS